jgi:PAS domain S-box-containing protein
VAIRNATLFAETEARRQAAEAAEARYRELFERSLAGILRTTAAGRILECNDAVVRMLGYASREELMTQNVMNLYADPADRAPVTAQLRAQQRLSNVELRWRRADGAAITLLANVAVLQDSAEGLVLDGTPDRHHGSQPGRGRRARRGGAARRRPARQHRRPRDQQPARRDHGPPRTARPAVRGRSRGRARVDKTLAACQRISDAHMGRITRLDVYQQSLGLPPILDLRRTSEPPPAEGPSGT